MLRVLGGARDHAVVAVMLVFPGFVELPGERVKFAELEEKEIVTECAAHVRSPQTRSDRNRSPARMRIRFFSPTFCLEA
jgi:hypothetical protein